MKRRSFLQQGASALALVAASSRVEGPRFGVRVITEFTGNLPHGDHPQTQPGKHPQHTRRISKPIATPGSHE